MLYCESPLPVAIITGGAAFSPAVVKVADVEGPVSIVINGVEAGVTDATGSFETVLGEGENRVAAFIPGVAAGVAFVEVDGDGFVNIDIKELEGEDVKGRLGFDVALETRLEKFVSMVW